MPPGFTYVLSGIKEPIGEEPAVGIETDLQPELSDLCNLQYGPVT